MWLALPLLVAPLGASAQPSPGDSEGHQTPWGDPDLQGVWNFRTPTPLERPEELGDRAMLSGEEAEAYLRQSLDANAAKLARGINADFVDVGETLAGGGQTSLIVEPADGRIPARTKMGMMRHKTLGMPDGARSADNPEDRALSARCIVVEASPILPTATGYNNNVQIFQTPDHVVILQEMTHETTIVPLDGRPRLATQIPQWSGSARGHWEGDTLVVETTNVHPQRTIFGSGPEVRITERFTRADDGTLRYDFTVDDPASFTSPWRAAFPLSRRDEPVYEFACHEGNRSMALILEVARAQDGN